MFKNWKFHRKYSSKFNPYIVADEPYKGRNKNAVMGYFSQ